MGDGLEKIAADGDILWSDGKKRGIIGRIPRRAVLIRRTADTFNDTEKVLVHGTF
jgi:hypothetical protein